ncbi:DUF2860 family protein [Vibrio tapetis]|uniref:DUF2860 domain-containing protein n=2 Tax=Vibrio tapetis TaxID=52443 RepID=A0A2N8ZH69_9VIBR|nr:DUF2860 family protein [Vibrio tapetis]AIY26214.1 conserved outer membrane protein [Vibrio tapetis]SON51254.1 conserved exported protein of unknown function [Vibrio tapetis subsp. tapetis]
MKKTQIALLLTATVVAAPSVARSETPQGFSGEIALNTAFFQSKSNLNTSAEAQRVENETPTTTSYGVFPLGNIKYTFDNHQLFAGTSRADIAVGTVALEAGYQYRFSGGTKWSVSVLPTVLASKVWQDPYQLTGGREETEEKGTAYRMQFKNIAGSLFNLDLAYGDSKVSDEQSGSEYSVSEQSQLERDRQVYYAKFDMMLPLSRTFLLFPAIKYIDSKADGNAMSNSALGGELTSIMIFGQHQFAATLGYMKHEYNEQHPVFSKTRSDAKIKSFIAYEYTDFFDIDSLSLVAFAGYNTSDSNIEFYDETGLVTSVGVNWKF